MRKKSVLLKLVSPVRLRFLIALATCLSLLAIVVPGYSVDVTAITAEWQSPIGSNSTPTCLNVDNGSATVQIRFGDDNPMDSDCPTTSVQSGLGFTPVVPDPTTIANGTPFLLGELIHFNNQVFASSLLTSATLNLNFTSTAPVLPTINTVISLEESPNNLATCPFGGTAPCPDRVTLTPSSIEFSEGGVDFQLEVVGLIPGTAATCTFSQAALRLSYISDENADNASCVYGRVTEISDAEMLLSKSTNVTSVSPGDIFAYKIDYSCSSVATACLGVTLTDYLPPELIFLDSTGSIHTIDDGIYSAGSHSVSFEMIDPLDAGSSGSVIIAVQVRDDGTLIEGQEIENTVTSTQANGPTISDTITTPVETQSNWEVTKSGDGVIYISSEPPITDATYTVQMCSNGSDVNMLDAELVDSLPPGAEFVSASDGGVYDSETHTVTWELGDLPADGGCVTRTVTVRFPSPPFTDGDTVVNEVTGTGTVPGEPPFTDSADVSNILELFVPDPSMTLDKSNARPDYVVGATVDYLLIPENTGNTPLYNLVLTDEVPAPIRVTEVETGGSDYPMVLEYSLDGVNYILWENIPAATNTILPAPADCIRGVRWRFNPGASTPPGWTLNPPARVTGTMISPDCEGNPVEPGQTIVNNATISWEYLPGGNGTCDDPDAECGEGDDNAIIEVVVDPVPELDKRTGGGVSAAERFLIGQEVGYFDLGINNNTGIAVDNLILIDAIPPQFGVTTVDVGTYANFAGTVGLRYQATNNPGVWVNWAGSPFAEGTSQNVSALVLPDGEYITDLEFSYGTVAGGFAGAPRIHGVTLEIDRNGVAVVDGDNMVNNSALSWTYLDVPGSVTDSTTDPIHIPTVIPTASKSAPPALYLPTGAVTWQLGFGLSNSSPSNVMNNPIVVDLLPEEVIFVSYTLDANGTAVGTPAFEQIDDYDGTGRVLLRWTFPGTLLRGETAFINLNTTLAAGTPSGILENTVGVTTDDMPVTGGDPDTGDLDGDGDTNDQLVTGTGGIPVSVLIGLDAVKSVRGQLDVDFVTFPVNGQTIPNGNIAYRMSLTNSGNVPINNIHVIDILPFVGDTGVINSSSRGSAWRPVLISPVTPVAGATIYYSTATNPCRAEIVSSGPVGCTPPNWSPTPPADLDTVRSLRFDFAGTMLPGQSGSFTWFMRAPDDAIPQGAIAWNSFAYSSANANTGVPLLPAEPNKVGVVYNQVANTALIDLVKYTNGEDADLPTGPQIPVTGTVTWDYVVTNTGTTRLADIILTDNVEDVITCPQTALNPGESMTCTLDDPSPQTGQYVNIAHVIGTAVDADGNYIDGDPDTAGIQLIQPTDIDPSHYFGYDPTLASIGDYTWIDSNYNGVQDTGEPPIGGVNIHLLDDTGAPVDDPAQPGTAYVTTSDVNGFYNFVNLPPGDYIVQFDALSIYAFTLSGVGASDEDSDANDTPGANLGRTPVVTLSAGEYNDTLDAGFIALAAVGDRIWLDTNGNGIQDPSENAMPPQLGGVPVNLMDSTGTTLIASVFTDPSGIYIFTGLKPDTYRIQFPAPPPGFLWTTQNAAGSTTTNDSDVDVVTNLTGDITLNAGDNDPTWDAGLVRAANIGDFVWADNNFNGRQDSDEPGVAGVVVTLLDSDGNPVTSDGLGNPISPITTASDGAYSFNNLKPGDYEVAFTHPTGYIFTTQNAGGAIASTDSDADITSGRTVVTTLNPGETDNTWDAGLIQLASLGDFVWDDSNNNGQQDGGEPGVAGAVVTLLDSTAAAVTLDALGNPINPITTLADGAYSFANLDPRIGYIVQFERPTTYLFALSNTGNDATDSDAVPSGTLPTGIGQTGVINLIAGANDTTIDAGLVVPASIGDFVFTDANNDGSQTGESGVSGVTVALLDSAGNPAVDEQGNLIAVQTTNGSGNYAFVDLRPATYSLYFSNLPTNYTFAQRDLGDDTLDSDPNRFTGYTVNTTLDPGEDDTSWDAGLVLAAALGDFVWEDRDADGQQDMGEPGIEGVTVHLLDGSNNPIDNPNTAVIGDAYFVVTDANGNYAFDGLPPNETYRVRFDRPANYVFTVSNTDSDITDSDGILNGQTTVANVTTEDITTLTPASTDDTWDQGLLLPSALGDFVWSDTNDDGLQTGGEPGISSVTVNLLDSAGNAVDNPNTAGIQDYTTTTDGSGIYSFINLYPGAYVVEFVTPESWKRADYFVGAGANAATDSNMQADDADAGRTPTITLPYNTTDTSWDAGFVPLAAIGDFVWRDENNNGIQEGGAEVGVAGAVVTLLDSAGNPVTTDGMGNPISPVTTPADGLYSFTNLDPDLDYMIEFTLPAPSAGVSGYKFSPQDAGGDTVDSDADIISGRTAIIPLNPGQTDNDRDAGLTPLATLGDYLWIDANGNGQQDSGEDGFNGAQVHLLDDLGNPVDDPNQAGTQDYVVTTANNPGTGDPGYYQFINLDAGTYIVAFDLPAGNVFTAQDVGADASDSDADRFTGRTGVYTLDWGDIDQTVDAGIVQPASLGDYVWLDTNDDGLQGLQAVEPGQNGVVVHLLDGDSNPVDNPNTVADDAYTFTTIDDPLTSTPGYYLFEGLLPGDYRVAFDLPSSNYVFAQQDQGADDSADSDADRGTGITAIITLSANEAEETIDAGILRRGQIGNRVWIDINNNGIQDSGEVGLNGVTVTLLNGSGGTDIDPILSGVQTLSTITVNDTTNGDGYYQFSDLVPGSYIVEFTLPAGYQFSPQDAGGDNALDSDADTTTGRTAVLTLPENGDDQTWDAGVVPLASIGDYTFIDQNGDGLQGGVTDADLEGVVVHLLDGDGNAVDDPNQAGTQNYVVTTASDGFYSFTNLPPDTSYIVWFELPANYHYSPVDANGNASDAIDSDADETTGFSPATLLLPGEFNDSIDAGFTPLARLGDFVWEDADGNGIQDAGEAGVNDVTVNLYDASNPGAPIATTTTVINPVGGAPGYYQFVDLVAGDYVVEFVTPAGEMITRMDQGGDDGVDSDADHLTGQTATITLDWGESNQTVDAGVLLPASLGDFAWADTNGNGVQEDGEIGVDEITVHLLDAGGNPVDNPNTADVDDPYVVQTNVNGAYAFTGLFPGSYIVQFDLPGVVAIFTLQDVGDDSLDSDADTITGRTGIYTLVAGQTDNTVDAGGLLGAYLGDFVWEDTNGNGVQDDGEPGIAGVTVHLLDSTGAAVDNPNTPGADTYVVQTNSFGRYLFRELFPGDYRVQFDLPGGGYIFTRLDQGSDDTADSDANRSNGQTGIYTLVTGQFNLTVDAGMLLAASLGDFVWEDTNGNGRQDMGEAGIDGITVHLLDENGAAVDNPNTPDVADDPYVVQTSGGGAYAFTGLFPGNYIVQFDLPGGGYIFTRVDQGGSDLLDSDTDRTTGQTGSYTLVAGQTDNTVDAGMVLGASIGDYVWLDMNDNGVQDAGDIAFADGATVHLLDENGAIMDTTTTGAAGDYLFSDLIPGTYSLQFVLPSDAYEFSDQNQGGDPALDSDADFTTGNTATTLLDADETDLTWDAGIVPLASIGDYVWVDMNNDGVQDGTESGAPEVTVNLLDDSETVIDTTTTDDTGFYLFERVSPGAYAIEFVLPTGYQFSPSNAGDDALDSDADFTTGRTLVTTLDPAEEDLTWDAGIVPLASIGDFVWRDVNNNGVQDAGETGIAGITVHLFTNPATILSASDFSYGKLRSTGELNAPNSAIYQFTSPIDRTTTTDSTGLYLFEDLPPGDYVIEVTKSIRYAFSPQDAGGDDTVDSDIDPITGRSAPTTLSPGENDLTLDVGFVPLATIGDRVWFDDNSNGVQDTGESGLPNITVNLLDAGGGILMQTTTDGGGNYLFENLMTGEYAVEFMLPVEYQFSPPDIGDDALDSDVDPTTGRTIVTTLDFGEVDLTWDAGIAPLGAIGDLVWHDANGDGQIDPGERGIPNVTVILTSPDGTTSSTPTDENGLYLFENLPAGDYMVAVDPATLPSGVRQTYDLNGPLDDSANYTLSIGETVLTLDFGYTRGNVTPPPIEPEPACPRACVDWQLYHTNQTGDWEIFRLGDLSDRPSLSPNLSQGEGADDGAPSRSPNAEWIVFSSNRDGNWELYAASTDGDSSKTRRLTFNTVAVDTDPVWGPNNTVVYETTRDGNWELYLLDMTTGAERRLTNNAASDINAFWSTDGTKLVFQSDRSGQWQIYELDLATNTVTLLSDGTAIDIDPQYSSNSSHIAFRSYRNGEKSTLYIIDSDGSNIRRISDQNGEATNLAWSSDDRFIAYQSDLDGDLDIYIYEVSTGITRKLTDNNTEDYAPTWDCDSATVIFTSEAGGNPDIYEADAEPMSAPPIDVTTDATQLTNNPADDIYPENSPSEEDASREGQLPEITLGEQTDFFNPDMSMTSPDPSLSSGVPWEPINSCSAICPACGDDTKLHLGASSDKLTSLKTLHRC